MCVCVKLFCGYVIRFLKMSSDEINEFYLKNQSRLFKYVQIDIKNSSVKYLEEHKIKGKTFTVYFNAENRILYYKVDDEKRIFENIQNIDLIFITIGQYLFAADILSDIALAVRYFWTNKLIYGCATLFFVIISSLANVFIFDRKQAYWYVLNNKQI